MKYLSWWVLEMKWANDIENQFAIIKSVCEWVLSIISNSTKYVFLAAQVANSEPCLLPCYAMWSLLLMPAKWPLPANKSLLKFTPIFLILPQTLVVCQNWLASNFGEIFCTNGKIVAEDHLIRYFWLGMGNHELSEHQLHLQFKF